MGRRCLLPPMLAEPWQDVWGADLSQVDVGCVCAVCSVSGRAVESVQITIVWSLRGVILCRER